MNKVCFNGTLFNENEAILKAQNRGFRYGDGLFETIKVYKGNILLEQFHFERLFLGLSVLKIETKDIVDPQLLSSNILQLCLANNCSDSARVRLAVYRDSNGAAAYVIEASFLDQSNNQINSDGFIIDVFPSAVKSPDQFSNLKTANYLPYVMADINAKENGLDDCLILNASGNICDASKANLFLIMKQQFYTPALNQGCVNGVMRRFLIGEIEKLNLHVHEISLTENDLSHADEVFLTNAIYGIRWVKMFRKTQFENDFTKDIYSKILSTIFN